MSAVGSSQPPGGGQAAPPCPVCGSPRTFETFQHYGERLYFCVDCEHTWARSAASDTRPGEEPGEEPDRPSRRRR